MRFWDQGRLLYFQFDQIVNIAQCLVSLDGIKFESGIDPLRIPLTKGTGLPFLPEHYTVWRNYSRVIGLQMLAAKIGNQLICTQLCHEIVSPKGEIQSADEYLAHLARTFYIPSPTSQVYDPKAKQFFPFAAIIKLLASKVKTSGQIFVSLEEVIHKVLGNSCRGIEPLAHYSKLTAKPLTLKGDEKRQLRELIIFISQFSFFKWENPNLIFDVTSVTDELINDLEKLATPIINNRNSDKGQEILNLGKLPGIPFKIPEEKDRVISIDEEFIEGKKKRVTHLRTERSLKLKQLFFNSLKHPFLCDICSLDTHAKYPWTDFVLEIHHLLPLSSPVRVEAEKTSIKDLVALCPNCHRATHAYYRGWLKTNNLDDFRDYPEAKSVYIEAKQSTT